MMSHSNTRSTFLFTLLLLLAPSALASRTITVHNKCGYRIWPAMFTQGGTAPKQATGWALAKGAKTRFNVAEDWQGRIWGRTGCDFTKGSTLPSTCVTGGCNGGLKCNKVGGTGVPPATLAEFMMSGHEGLQFYDISAVDGSNIPMKITPSVKSCRSPTCKKNINAICPAELSVHDKKGKVQGCLSSCAANIDGHAANSRNCCSGQFNTPQTCPKSGVEHYGLFKKACPDAYAYAYDESSGSALWTCPKSKKANYTITFCP